MDFMTLILIPVVELSPFVSNSHTPVKPRERFTFNTKFMATNGSPINL